MKNNESSNTADHYFDLLFIVQQALFSIVTLDWAREPKIKIFE